MKEGEGEDDEAAAVGSCIEQSISVFLLDRLLFANRKAV